MINPQMNDEEFEKFISEIENNEYVEAPPELTDMVLSRIETGKQTKTVTVAFRIVLAAAAAVIMITILPELSKEAEKRIESTRQDITVLTDKEDAGSSKEGKDGNIPSKEEYTKNLGEIPSKEEYTKNLEEIPSKEEYKMNSGKIPSKEEYLNSEKENLWDRISVKLEMFEKKSN